MQSSVVNVNSGRCSGAANHSRVAKSATLARRSAPRSQARVLQPSHAVMNSNIAISDQLKHDELMKRFAAADKDGDGKIDREELRGLLESKGGRTKPQTQHWLTDAELDSMMKVYDTNKSGTIELDEFKKLVYDGLLLDDYLEEYMAAFRAVDKSGDGSIGAMELAQLLQALGQPISYEKLVTLMQRYDKDESGKIEFNEFLTMFRDGLLLDLEEVTKYLATLPEEEVRASQDSGSGRVFEPVPGDLNPIFSERELNEAIEGSQGKLVVLFAALTWCRACKSMQRPVQKIAAAYQDQAVFLKIFGNSNGQTKALFRDRLAVRSTPCFVAFKDGKMVFTQMGGNKEKLEAGLREHMDPSTLPKKWVFRLPAVADEAEAEAAAAMA